MDLSRAESPTFAPLRAVEEKPASRPRLTTGRPLVFLVGVGLVVSTSAATQFVAYRFAFHPNLGPHLFALEGTTVRYLRAAAVLAAGATLALSLLRSARHVAPLLVLAAVVAFGLTIGPVYEPQQLFVWYAAYGELPGFDSVFRGGFLVLATSAIATTGSS